MAAVNQRNEYEHYDEEGWQSRCQEGQNTERPVLGLQIDGFPGKQVMGDLEAFSWIETTHKTLFLFDHQRSDSNT